MVKSKKGGSLFGGIVIGIIMVIGGIILLNYNEGRTVKTKSAIMEAEKTAVEVSSDKIDSSNDNKLISTNGSIVLSDEELKDEKFDVSVATAKLVRNVEIYQWVEECSTDSDNNETCTYKQEWKNELVNSSNFRTTSGHENPTSVEYENKTYVSDNVHLGEFLIPSSLVEGMSTKATYSNLNEEEASTLGLTISNNYYTNVKENKPEVGNIRISFVYNDTKEASIIGVQSGDSFTGYVAKSKVTIFRLYEEKLSLAQIIQKLTDENNFYKWILRLAGTLLIIFGLASIMSPIQKLASYVPILGGLVGGVTALIAFIVGLAISLLVIAVSWIMYRPLLGIVLLISVVGLIILAINISKKKKNSVDNNINNTNNVDNPPIN